MTQIVVFMDTSALPRNPAYPGIGFERLIQLVDTGLVKVFLSEVVVSEWTSQLQADFLEKINVANKSLRQAVKHPWSAEIQGFEIIMIAQEKMTAALKSVAGIAEKKVKEIIQQLQAEILHVGSHHGKLVVSAYFEGMAPFKKPKNREDFPDAFIFQCAIDLAEQLDSTLHCIVVDKALSTALSQLENATLHRTINDFVQSETVVERAHEQEAERIWQATLEKIRPLLRNLEDDLKAQLEDLYLDVLACTRVSHPGIPDDNHEAYISELYEPTNITFDWERTEDYGAGLIALPFRFDCDAGVQFMIFRADAYDVSDGVWVDYGDPEENYYFEAGGYLSLSISGVMSLRFNLKPPTGTELPDLLYVRIDRIDEKDVLEDYTGRIFHEMISFDARDGEKSI